MFFLLRRLARFLAPRAKQKLAERRAAGRTSS